MFIALLLLLAAQPIAPPPIITPRASPPPIVRTNTVAPAWQYRQWVARDLGDSTIASTTNASQSAFGAVCGQECVWFVNFQTQCAHGSTYPAMINSPLGAYSITLRCYHFNEYRLLTFPMDDTSMDMLADTGEVGFAFPLDSGKFGVSRFSLAGGVEAVTKALEVAIAKQNSNQEGLRDFTI